MPTDPRPADVELVTKATEAHHIVFTQTDANGNNPCVCGNWWDGADGPGWDEHMAEAALSALAAAGRLLTEEPRRLSPDATSRPGRCRKCGSPCLRCEFCDEMAQCGEVTCVAHTAEES